MHHKLPTVMCTVMFTLSLILNRHQNMSRRNSISLKVTAVLMLSGAGKSQLSILSSTDKGYDFC